MKRFKDFVLEKYGMKKYFKKNDIFLELVSIGDIESVKEYIEMGIDINHQNKSRQGYTAIMIAIEMGDYNMCKLLLENGADPYIQADFGDDAISIAEFVKDGRITRLLKKYLNESLNENLDNFRLVSQSLLFNFLTRVNDLGLKFNLDVSYIKGRRNSLNNKNYVLYLETDNINNSYIETEFKNSKMLSDILQYLEDKSYDSKSNFYIGFDDNSKLHFGIIINNKKYKIGFTGYKSQDFNRLIPYIKTDSDINLSLLSKKLISTLKSLSIVKEVLDLHLSKYDDIDTYVVLIDNVFNIIIDSVSSDVINKNYILNIISNNIKFPHHISWELNTKNNNGDILYFFTFK